MYILSLITMILIVVVCAAATIVSITSLVMYFIEEYNNIREKLNDIL